MRTRPVWRAGATALALTALTAGLALAQDRGEPVAAEEELALGDDVAETVGPPELTPPVGAELEARTEELAHRMRCPVCQGHSIADSPSESARNMKRLVRAMVAAGYAEDQIFLYFETSYGEFIRLMPKAEGINLLVWIVPVVALLAGFAVVVGFVRRRPAPQPVSGASAADPGTPPTDAEAPVAAATVPPDAAVAEDDLAPWLVLVRKEAASDDA